MNKQLKQVVNNTETLEIWSRKPSHIIIFNPVQDVASQVVQTNSSVNNAQIAII